MKRVKRKRPESEFDRVETVLFMEGIFSREHFYTQGQKPCRVLKDIDLIFRRPESWAVYGRSFYEIKLLLEIMANIKPYHDGKCVLVERGMMRNKRVILEHVFYIGAPTMLYDNMNVLEYLMFATARKGFSPVYRQAQLLELLIDIGLGHISLTAIKRLSREEKAVVTLAAAACSESVMIVFNLPEYVFGEALAGAIVKISGLLMKRGKTFILGSRDPLLIEKACSHAAYVAEGRIIYRGTVEKLCARYDRVLLVIRDRELHRMAEQLSPILPRHKLSIAGDSLLISDSGDESSDPHYVYKKIIEQGFAPQHVGINPKTVQNALEELERQYDLQKQLFQ